MVEWIKPRHPILGALVQVSITPVPIHLHSNTPGKALESGPNTNTCIFDAQQGYQVGVQHDPTSAVGNIYGVNE